MVNKPSRGGRMNFQQAEEAEISSIQGVIELELRLDDVKKNLNNPTEFKKADEQYTFQYKFYENIIPKEKLKEIEQEYQEVIKTKNGI